jgi:glycosyltransferase involved in cell wall biosynthesis
VIVHHTFLERRGGATRVARMVMAGCKARGLNTSHVFEHAETEGGLSRRPWREAIARAAADPETIIHVHTSRDWAELFELLAPARGRIVVTLHDLALVSGGCVYPLDCQLQGGGCGPACPQGFTDAAERSAANREALVRLGAVVVSPSRWLKLEAARAWEGVSVRVAPNGVEWPERAPSLEDKAAARGRFGLSPEARVVLFAAHGGVEATFKAGQAWTTIFEGIKAAVPQAVALAAGCEEEGRDGDFIRLPYLDRAHMQAAFTAADVFVYPTLADNHPLVVLEAMSRGTCVVAFGVGGVPEQIRDGATGVVAPAGRGDVLVAEAARLLAEPARARALGRTAFEQGAGRFSLERMTTDYMRIYAGLRPQSAS